MRRANNILGRQSEEKDHLEGPRIDGTTILKLILIK